MLRLKLEGMIRGGDISGDMSKLIWDVVHQYLDRKTVKLEQIEAKVRQLIVSSDVNNDLVTKAVNHAQSTRQKVR